MFSLFNHSKEDLSIIIDLSYGSVSLNVISKTKATPEIIYHYRKAQSAQLLHTKNRLDSLVTVLTEVIQHFRKEGLIEIHKKLQKSFHIKEVKCIFSASLYKAETKVINIEKEHDILITKEVIEDIVQKELDEYKKNVRDADYTAMFGNTVKTLEQELVETKLNGYPVKNLLGKRAHEIEFTLYISFISKQIIESIEKIIYKVFSGEKIHFYSSAFVSLRAIKTMVPDVQDFLCSHIRNETTDIILVHKGIIKQIETYPLGFNNLLRDVAKKLNVSTEVAASFITLHYNGATEAGFSEKLSSALDKYGEKWRQCFIESLQKFSNNYSLPKKLMVTVDEKNKSIFLPLMQKELPPELSIFNNSLDIVVLNPLEVTTHSSVL